MEVGTYFSEKLGLNYKIKLNKNGQKVAVFEDDCNYNSYEMSKIKGVSNTALKNIHLIKLMFEGIII